MNEEKNTQAARQTVDLIDNCLQRDVVTPLRLSKTSIDSESIYIQMKMDKSFSESIDKAQNRTSHDNIVVAILKSMFSKK